MQDFINQITLQGFITGFVLGAIFVAIIARVEINRARRK